MRSFFLMVGMVMIRARSARSFRVMISPIALMMTGPQASNRPHRYPSRVSGWTVHPRWPIGTSRQTYHRYFRNVIVGHIRLLVAEIIRLRSLFGRVRTGAFAGSINRFRTFSAKLLADPSLPVNQESDMDPWASRRQLPMILRAEVRSADIELFPHLFYSSPIIDWFREGQHSFWSDKVNRGTLFDSPTRPGNFHHPPVLIPQIQI